MTTFQQDKTSKIERVAARTAATMWAALEDEFGIKGIESDDPGGIENVLVEAMETALASFWGRYQLDTMEPYCRNEVLQGLKALRAPWDFKADPSDQFALFAQKMVNSVQVWRAKDFQEFGPDIGLDGMDYRDTDYLLVFNGCWYLDYDASVEAHERGTQWSVVCANQQEAGRSINDCFPLLLDYAWGEEQHSAA